jgi:hypothetical protein
MTDFEILDHLPVDARGLDVISTPERQRQPFAVGLESHHRSVSSRGDVGDGELVGHDQRDGQRSLVRARARAELVAVVAHGNADRALTGEPTGIFAIAHRYLTEHPKLVVLDEEQRQRISDYLNAGGEQT